MPAKTHAPVLATIGYEGTTVPRFLAALTAAGIDLLVDVRAVASSRRPGFAKTALAANLQTVGIEYRHLRALGTPADGRAAARAGRHDEMQAIFRGQLATEDAQEALHELGALVGERRVAILCFERDPAHCHRTLVAEALRARMRVEVAHLFAADEDQDDDDA